MRPVVHRRNSLRAHLGLSAALFVLIASFASCNKSANQPSQTAVEKTFASPEDAGEALFQATKSNDEAALQAIFGPNAKQILSSGDAVKDKDALQGFVDSYTQMHRWREIKSGGEMLSTGADNWIFPIPLGRNSAGQWYFDTAAGQDEMLARRIGRDELTAIAACEAIANAQNEYFRQSHDDTKQYALKLISDQGKENGLYWPVSPGQKPSPLEDVRDFAKAAGYTNAGDNPQPFDGYFFRILTKQGDQAKGGAKDYVVNGKMTGGFAVLAYPAEYRNSGIMTFIVGTDGIVYQKDLGEKTAELGPAMTEYDPANGWNPAL
jgi:Protein of unknown function (DUF2950)